MSATQVRNLNDNERERLCDLLADCGEGDLLDFIQLIKTKAKQLGISEPEVIELFARIPA
jgi:hypothetical protein